MLPRPDSIEPTLRDLNFWGRRPGLRDLPPVPVVELTGEEFGSGLWHSELMQKASDFLRRFQSEPGLQNDDTGWRLKINAKSRKKMGDNQDQSVSELQAVAAIESLARAAIVVERHEDDKNKNPYVLSVLRLYVPLLIGDDLYRVRLTVKDYGASRMLHALTSMEIDSALGQYSHASDTSVQHGLPTARTMSIADLLKGATDNKGKPYDM